jgi:hypothetical protein
VRNDLTTKMILEPASELEVFKLPVMALKPFWSRDTAILAAWRPVAWS